MDVLVLIDKLDDQIHNAKPVPLTDQVRVDKEEIYDILDQMRATIPEEIKQARWIVKERQEMLAEAKRECDRLIGEGREQAVRSEKPTSPPRRSSDLRHDPGRDQAGSLDRQGAAGDAGRGEARVRPPHRRGARAGC